MQEEEERLRREEERASKRLQKTAESAQSAGPEEDEQQELSGSQAKLQPTALRSAAAAATSQVADSKDAIKLQDPQQIQQQQQQPQAKLQEAVVPAAKLTKAQRQRYAPRYVIQVVERCDFPSLLNFLSICIGGLSMHNFR